MNQSRQPSLPLSRLLQDISTQVRSNDPQITGLCIDSRKVKPGDCFFAYPGSATDGRKYIEQALAGGAAVVLYEPHPDIKPSAHCIPIPNIQQHIGTIASRFWALNAEQVTIIGVTGTNGKSTSCYWLAGILAQAGIPSAVIGTIGMGPIANLRSNSLTTPDPISLYAAIADYVAQGIKVIAMEVSSHSLMQYRVSGLPIKYAAFTNLSHEHLDYHGTMRDYAAAKARLFDMPTLQGAVINADDTWGRQWLQSWVKDYPILAMTNQANAKLPKNIARITASNIVATDNALQFTLQAPFGHGHIRIPAMGEFNVQNAMVCVGMLHYLGFEWGQITDLLSTLPQVPGRMQVIKHDHLPTCVVDYAHTPDALKNALTSLRAHCRGKLWCVFGCGGDRDQAKRPTMGKMAAINADLVILTDDNPRTESAEVIIRNIRDGIPETCQAPYIANRRDAIAHAITHAAADDVILVAGKGHETMQLIGEQKIPFSDVETITSLLQKDART